MATSPTRIPVLLGLWLALGAAAGCRGGGGEEGGGAVGPQEGFNHPMVGRAAPDFVGEVPSRGWLPLVSLRGKPIALLIFKPSSPFARELVTALGSRRNDPDMSGIVFLGVAVDSNENIQRFVAETRDVLPTLRDPGTIAPSYGVGDAPALILLDTKRFVRFRLDGFAGAGFRQRVAASLAAIRTLPSLGAGEPPDVTIEYRTRPRAPWLSGRDLDGRMVDLGEHKGQVVALVFFDQDSPQCQRDLPRLSRSVRAVQGRGVLALGVSSRDLNGGLRDFLRRHDVDFPVIIDPDRAIFTRYAATGAPDLFIIDGEGNVRFRESGESADREEITLLQLRLALGDDPQSLADNPDQRQKVEAMHARRLEGFKPGVEYVGAEACRDCHRAEYDQWRATPHAAAFTRLIRQDRGGDPACQPCHTTGFGQRRGFDDVMQQAAMVHVQCEVCHGPGADHLAAPANRKAGTIYGLTGDCPSCDLQGVCVTCHDAKNDPDFDIGAALPRVTH